MPRAAVGAGGRTESQDTYPASTSAESWSRTGDPVQLTGEICRVNRLPSVGLASRKSVKAKLSKHAKLAAALGCSSLGLRSRRKRGSESNRGCCGATASLWNVPEGRAKGSAPSGQNLEQHAWLCIWPGSSSHRKVCTDSRAVGNGVAGKSVTTRSGTDILLISLNGHRLGRHLCPC